MKTSRRLAALLLTASPAVAQAAVTRTVTQLDGTGTIFSVGTVFDTLYETHYSRGAGARNVSETINGSSGAFETYPPAGALPDHSSVYTARNNSMTAGKAVVTNGASTGFLGGFIGASGKSSGPAAKLDSKTSGDTAPAEGLKSLMANTFSASFLGTLQLQPGTGQGVSEGSALEDPVDWRWASLYDSDKSIWKFADRTGGTSAADGKEKPQALTMDNLGARRNVIPKKQSFIRKFFVVSAPEPAGVLTIASFLGLALSSRRRSAIRL
ncbi:MAG: hypothetical protein JWM59_903 [Verrucomicrobiales bacterium]|nr:hypothetical protein [Verrucomicrobiales bacterium]